MDVKSGSHLEQESLLVQRETVRTIKTEVVERSRVWEQSSSKLCLVDGGGCEGAGKAGRREEVGQKWWAKVMDCLEREQDE